MTEPAADTSAILAETDSLVLASMASPIEMELVTTWLDQQRSDHPGANFDLVTLPALNAPPEAMTFLAEQLESGEDRSIVPVRVFWLPPPDRGRLARLTGLLPGRDPYHPNQRMQAQILRGAPQRARVVAGESATVSELRRQWRDTTVGDDKSDFAQFVIRRAILAMERVEYRILGPQYKSPRLVKPEILASNRFRAGLAKIPGATVDEAGKMLDELATGWSRASVDLVSVLGRMISRGFDPEIDYDEYQVAAMRTGLEAHPAVLLFSHRSYIDGAVVPVAMQENRLPPVHVFAGINLSFGAMGPLLRRSGVIFIRRNIGNDQLYKYVLREYVGYIVEKRFNLSWSIEGTRSRTGKMLPPKLGLLAYVADAYLDGRSEDILLQPVSISFDQLHETAEYAAYARGGEKTPEGVGWLYNFIRAQGERNYGKIYVRFPEAVSMRQYLGAPHGPLTQDPDAKRLALQKMSFEVAWRILQATPVTATGLVCALLLTTRGAALTLGQLHHTLQDSLDYLERKQNPMSTSALRLRSHDGVRAAVDALSNGHPITRVDGGREPVWHIAPEHQHAAAFYRNSVIHAFLETSIVELALAHARHAEGDRMAAFWAQATRLRDLLKFDFYFADSATFRDHIAEEMAWHDNWQAHVARARDRRPAVRQASADGRRDAAGVLRGLRDRRRRAARRPGRHRPPGTDRLGARRRSTICGPDPGPQQRIGVDAVVRHRAPGRRGSGPDRPRPGPGRTASRLPARIARHSPGLQLRRTHCPGSVRGPRAQGASGPAGQPTRVAGTRAHTLGV